MYVTAWLEITTLAQRRLEAQKHSLLPASDMLVRYLRERGDVRYHYINNAQNVQESPWESIILAFPMLPQVSYRYFSDLEAMDQLIKLSQAGQTDKLIHLSLFPLFQDKPVINQTLSAFNPRRELITTPLMVQAMETLALFSDLSRSFDLVPPIIDAISRARSTVDAKTYQVLLKNICACVEFSQDVAEVLQTSLQYQNRAPNDLKRAINNLGLLKAKLTDTLSTS